MALHTLEICSGVGMLGEGLRAGLQYMGVETRTVCHIEREAYAAAVLAARMEEGSMDPAPVWSDLLTFDAAAWRGAVDCIVAGFPCQDLSLAGKRAGLDGKRSGLFFDICDIADACGARFLFLENVAGIASATASTVDEESASEYVGNYHAKGFSQVGVEDGRLLERAAARVMGELADRGWDAEWITLSASDVGASHGRSRWFCWAWRVAHAERAERRPECAGSFGSVQGNDGHGREADGGAGIAEQVLGAPNDQRTHRSGSSSEQDRSAEPAHASGRLAHPTGDGRDQGRPESSREQGRPDVAECGCAVADTSSSRCQGSELGRTLHGNRGGRKHMDQLSNFVAHSSHLAQPIPDGQTSSESGPDSLPPSQKRLNAAFGELLMGWPTGHTIAEPRDCGASEMELWRRRLAWQLSCCLGEPESFGGAHENV